MLLKDLKEKLTDDINTSNLPIDAIYFIMKDLMREVDDIYTQEIQKEEIAKIKKEQDESGLTEAIENGDKSFFLKEEKQDEETNPLDNIPLEEVKDLEEEDKKE